MHIVLYQPEIPQNTGNIARTCAATGTVLHLIRPLGFSIDERSVRRAGLDYWHMVSIHDYEDWDAFLVANPEARLHLLTTKAPRPYSQASYSPDDYLVFGRETAGLPEALLREHIDRCIRIPMLDGARSLNLANSAAIVLYEALRQQGFDRLVSNNDKGLRRPTL